MEGIDALSGAHRGVALWAFLRAWLDGVSDEEEVAVWGSVNSDVIFVWGRFILVRLG